MTTIIQKWGNSPAIKLSQSLLALLQWQENDELSILIQDQKIILERTPRSKSIEELFEGYNGNYTPEEMDWGTPKGEELW